MRNLRTVSLLRALVSFSARVFRSPTIACALGGAALLPFAAFGQATGGSTGPGAPSAATTNPNGNGSQIVTLSPFEVTQSQDNSYGALQSSSLTAFSMDMQKMPATAEVFTQQFIQDTNSLTVEQMLLNYSGIVGYSPGDSGAYTESAGDRDGSGGLSIRGFGNGGSIKIDGFFGPPSSTRSAAGSTPSFMLQQVEVIEGPQSLLYGAIGAGGVINATYKKANFGQTDGTISYLVNDYGGKVTNFDYNVGNDTVALRVAATDQNNATDRINIGNTTNGYYLQGAIRLPDQTIVRLIHNDYETFQYGTDYPSLKGLPGLPSTSPLYNDTTQYLAATNQVPAGIFNTPVNWYNIGSFAGWMGNSEPSYISNSELEIESTPLNYRDGDSLSIKINALYNQYEDWRISAASGVVTPGASDPYSVDAFEDTPGATFESQRQKAAQVAFLSTNNFFNDTAKSQTVLLGYVNHVGPSFGSSGITYKYEEADSNWNPIVGTSTTNYGHIFMGTQLIPLNGTIDKYPLFYPLAPRVTVNGLNYILEPQIEQNAAYKGFPIPGQPTNPYGLVPNGGNNLTNTPYGGNYTFSGSFNPGTEEHEEFMTIGNYTDWFNGRLETLAGVSVDKAISYNFGTTAPTFIPWTRYNGWELGAIYQVTKWMGVYLDIGTAATPAGSTNDLYGNPLPPTTAKGQPELGIKLHTPDQRYSAQLAWDPTTTDQNEQQGVDGSYLNAVNPNGINGRFGNGPNTHVDVARAATTLEFVASANPVPNWRLRFAATELFARILDSVTYAQLYNDQFHTNSAGDVTYANGTVVYVNGAATTTSQAAIVAPTTAGAVPLTTSLLSNSSSPYWVNPDPTSGAISSTVMQGILGGQGTAGSVQSQMIAANGGIATGVTGLPISQNQYGFVSPFPNGVVPIFYAGDPATGYPGMSLNLETDYTISSGLFKGLGVFLDGIGQYFTHAYYTYYPTAANVGTENTQVVNEHETMVTLPPIVWFDLGVHYTRKFKGLTWTTEIEAQNLFNHDPIYIEPQAAANGEYLTATQRTSPRTWQWSNTIAF